MFHKFHEINRSRRSFLKNTAAFSLTYSALAAANDSSLTPANGKLLAYAGTYSSAVDGGANGEGIYLFQMDTRTGELSAGKLVARTPNPTWIVIHPSKKYLYAIDEVTNYQGGSGSVTAFAMNSATGELALINTVSSAGASPAHLSLDAKGSYAFVANYAGGSIAVLPIHSDGSLGAAVDVHRDSGSVGPAHASGAPRGSFAVSGHDAPHAHMIAADPAGRFVLATDLAQDRIYVYRFDAATGKLTPPDGAPFASLPPGGGPRHFAFHPNGHWLYVLLEEASTIVFFLFDPQTGALAADRIASALPPGFAGTSFASEIALSPDGRFIYSANRLHDTISVFAIGPDGRHRLIGEASSLGDYPRHFRIDPTGNFLHVCNQKSDSIATFRRDRDSGWLTFTGSYTPIGSPAVLTFIER